MIDALLYDNCCFPAVTEVQKWIWRLVATYYDIIMLIITEQPQLFALIARRISANIRATLRLLPEWYVDLKKRSRFTISHEKVEEAWRKSSVMTS